MNESNIQLAQAKINKHLILADRLESLSQQPIDVSHEIRNPLASIMLFVDILADPNRFNRTNQELEILGEVKENVEKNNRYYHSDV